MPGAPEGKGEEEGPRKPEVEEIAAKVARFAEQLAAHLGVKEADRKDLSQMVAFRYICEHSSNPAFLNFEGFAKGKARQDVHRSIIDRDRSDTSREAREGAWETERAEENSRDIHDILDSREDDPATLLRERELFAVAGFALNGMSKKKRTLFLMHKLDGVSLEDTAATLGMNVGAAKQALFRTAQQLRAALVGYRRATR
jgi:RNA polymerase sigma factor (sigma-70 family)